MRASRRGVLAAYRHPLRADSGTLVAEDFLTLADRPAVHTGSSSPSPSARPPRRPVRLAARRRPGRLRAAEERGAC
jgi:hypothetical protein